MTPTVAQLLQGVIVGLSTPLPPEAGGAYAASRMGMLAALTNLSIQENERGVSVRVWENRAIAEVLAGAAGRYTEAGDVSDADPGELTVSALDARNAALRRRLIAVHAAAEQVRDTDLDHRILRLYREMAMARRLTLGG